MDWTMTHLEVFIIFTIAFVISSAIDCAIDISFTFYQEWKAKKEGYKF